LHPHDLRLRRHLTTIAAPAARPVTPVIWPRPPPRVERPSGLAFDSSGNLYIADTANNVIRKITGTTITPSPASRTGSGYGGDLGAATSANLSGPTAIAFDSAGNYYIADNGNSLIRKVDTRGIITSYLGSGATDKRLNYPNGLGVRCQRRAVCRRLRQQSPGQVRLPNAEQFRRHRSRGFLRRWRSGGQGSIE